MKKYIVFVRKSLKEVRIVSSDKAYRYKNREAFVRINEEFNTLEDAEKFGSEIKFYK